MQEATGLDEYDVADALTSLVPELLELAAAASVTHLLRGGPVGSAAAQEAGELVRVASGEMAAAAQAAMATTEVTSGTLLRSDDRAAETLRLQHEWLHARALLEAGWRDWAADQRGS